MGRTDSTSLKEWAAKPSGSKRKCGTCTRFGHLLADIETFHRLKLGGATDRSYAEFHAEILVPQGYTPTAGALGKHIHRCLDPLNLAPLTLEDLQTK